MRWDKIVLRARVALDAGERAVAEASSVSRQFVSQALAWVRAAAVGVGYFEALLVTAGRVRHFDAIHVRLRRFTSHARVVRSNDTARWLSPTVSSLSIEGDQNAF